MRLFGSLFISTCVALALGACGDDDGGTGTDAGVDAGPAPTDGGGGGDGTLTVHVYRVDDGEQSDADGVAVALDTPAGRAEGTTAGDGTYTFEGIDWAGDAVTVSAWEAGRIMLAFELEDDPGAEHPMNLLPAASPRDDLVSLSGSVAGMDDTTNTLVVSSTTGGFASGAGVGWTMQVPPDEAGTLIAMEIAGVDSPDRVSVFDVVQAATVDFDAPGTSATVDIDFAADGVTTSTATGSIDNPSSPRPSSIVNAGEVFVRVSSRDTGAFLGTATRMEISSDESTIDYDVEYVELAGAAEPITSFLVTDTPEQAAVTVNGWPSDGAQDVTFLDPPDVTAPAFGEDLAWGSIARWDTADTEARSSLQAFDRDTGFSRAILVVAPGASSGSMPEPPGGASVEDVAAGSELDGRVLVCDNEGAPNPWQCQRYGRSRAFGVTP